MAKWDEPDKDYEMNVGELRRILAGVPDDTALAVKVDGLFRNIYSLHHHQDTPRCLEIMVNK